MYQYSADAKSADIRDSIQFQLEEIDKDLAALKKGKNILAGSSLSAATAVVIWLFKTFEDDLVNLVKRLVGAG